MQRRWIYLVLFIAAVWGCVGDERLPGDTTPESGYQFGSGEVNGTYIFTRQNLSARQEEYNITAMTATGCDLNSSTFGDDELSTILLDASTTYSALAFSVAMDDANCTPSALTLHFVQSWTLGETAYSAGGSIVLPNPDLAAMPLGTETAVALTPGTYQLVYRSGEKSGTLMRLYGPKTDKPLGSDAPEGAQEQFIIEETAIYHLNVTQNRPEPLWYKIILTP